MIRYPQQVASQQPILGPLAAMQAEAPVGSAWIRLHAQITAQAPTLGAPALLQCVAIGQSLGKVFGTLQTRTPQSLPEIQWLQILEQTAWGVARETYLLALSASGGGVITLSQAANQALTALQAWDPVLGYAAPSHPAALGLALVQGVTFT